MYHYLPAGQGGRPLPAADATRQLADRLTDTLGPHMMSDDPPAEVRILWHAAKLLSAMADGWERDSVPVADWAYAQWSDVAEIASDIAGAALSIAADGMTGAQAAEHLSDAELATANANAALAATPAGVLQVAHHLRRLGTILAGSVAEPREADLPLGGRCGPPRMVRQRG